MKKKNQEYKEKIHKIHEKKKRLLLPSPTNIKLMH